MIVGDICPAGSTRRNQHAPEGAEAGRAQMDGPGSRPVDVERPVLSAGSGVPGDSPIKSQVTNL